MRLNPRQVVQLLKFVRGIVLLAVPATAAAWWITIPEAAAIPESPQTVNGGTQRPVTTRDLSWYAPLWECDLNQPPNPPITQETTTAPEIRQDLPGLLATLISSDQRLAHFRGERDRLELRAVGESVSGFRVVAIESGRVQLETPQGPAWLTVPRKPTRP